MIPLKVKTDYENFVFEVDLSRTDIHRSEPRGLPSFVNVQKAKEKLTTVEDLIKRALGAGNVDIEVVFQLSTLEIRQPYQTARYPRR